MGFGAGLGAFTSGIDQGANQQIDMRTKMMQLQQLQMALDQAKKQFTAQAAYGRYLGAPASPSPGGAPSGAPGSQQASPQVPGAPPTSPFQMGGAPPQPQQPMGGSPPGGMSGPPGAMAPQRPPMAPQGGMPPQGGSPPQQGGGGLQQMTQMLNSGQLDPAQAVQTLGARIAAANPGIDPETLALAVEQAVNVMHGAGLDPATKLQMQLMLQSAKDQASGQRQDARDQTQITTTGMRDQTSQANTGARDATQVQTTGMRDDTSTANTATRESGENQRLQTRLSDADNHFNQTFQRLTSSDRWKQMSAAQKQLYEQQKGKLQTRLTAAKAKVAAAVADPANVDKAGLAAANKEIADIDSQLDRISTVGTGQPSGGSRGVAPDAGRNSAEMIRQARAAIAQGAPRAAVIQKLQSMGINPAGL